MVASSSVVSIIAKLLPMHWRRPPPNGKSANRSAAARGSSPLDGSGAQRSGSRTAGPLPEARIVVQHPLAHQHDHAAREPPSTDSTASVASRICAETGGISRIDSVIDPLRIAQPWQIVDDRRAAAQHLGQLGLELLLAAGCWASRGQVQLMATAVVSWPARNRVMISSRSCRSVMPLPSSSRARSSSYSSRRAPQRWLRRCSMIRIKRPGRAAWRRAGRSGYPGSGQVSGTRKSSESVPAF